MSPNEIGELRKENINLKDLLSRLTSEKYSHQGPTIYDLCFTAFMKAHGNNEEDGGPTDWMNDTRPIIKKEIERIRRAI